MPPFAAISLQGLEAHLDSEVRPTKKVKTAHRVPRQIIEPATQEALPEIVDDETPTPSKRPSRSSAKRPNYDMKFHPMDDVIRPAFAARRRGLTRSSTQTSGTISLVDSTPLPDTKNIADADQDDELGYSAINDDPDDDDDNDNEIDQDVYGSSSMPRVPDLKASRRSSRSEALKPVNYSCKVHPQDYVLPGRGRGMLHDLTGQVSPSTQKNAPTSRALESTKHKPGASELTDRIKQKTAASRRPSQHQPKATQETVLLDSPSPELVSSSPSGNAVGDSLSESAGSLFEAVSSISSTPGTSLVEQEDVSLVENRLDISATEPNLRKCNANLEALVQRVSQPVRKQLLQILQRDQSVSTSQREGNQLADATDAVARFRSWRGRRNDSDLAPSSEWYQSTFSDAQVPASAQGQGAGDLLSTMTSSATAPIQPLSSFDISFYSAGVSSASTDVRTETYPLSSDELEIPESDTTVLAELEKDIKHSLTSTQSSRTALSDACDDRALEEQV